MAEKRPCRLVATAFGARNKANKADLEWDKASKSELSELLERLEAVERRQELMEQRQTEAEAVRRGQLDCLSERVFEAEKKQREAQERTEDAIEKARLEIGWSRKRDRYNVTCIASCSST